MRDDLTLEAMDRRSRGYIRPTPLAFDRGTLRQAERMMRKVYLAKIKKDGYAAFTEDTIEDMSALCRRLATLLTGDAYIDATMRALILSFGACAEEIRNEMYG